MNIKMTSLALVLVATSAAAFAADEFVEHTNIVSTRTRAEVRAELEQAQSSGQVARETEFIEHAPLAAGKTRTEVRAELDQAYAQGLVGHTPEFVEHTHIVSTRSRDEVRNEAIQAAKAPRTIAPGAGS